VEAPQSDLYYLRGKNEEALALVVFRVSERLRRYETVFGFLLRILSATRFWFLSLHSLWIGFVRSGSLGAGGWAGFFRSAGALSKEPDFRELGLITGIWGRT